MKRRDLLKGLAVAFSGGAIVQAGQKLDSSKQLIVNVECVECAWKGKFPLKLNEHGFYSATEAICPKCFTQLDQTVTYEENPTLETPEQRKKRQVNSLQKEAGKYRAKEELDYSEENHLGRIDARLKKLNGVTE